MPTALVALTHQVLLVDVQRLAHVPIDQVEQWPQTQAQPEVPELAAGAAPWVDCDISTTISGRLHAGEGGRHGQRGGRVGAPDHARRRRCPGRRREARRYTRWRNRGVSACIQPAGHCVP